MLSNILKGRQTPDALIDKVRFGISGPYFKSIKSDMPHLPPVVFKSALLGQLPQGSYGIR